MSDLPRYLRDLEEALLDLPDDTDAMLLSELDGYVAGLAVLPADIPAEEWLPAIWRPNPETPDYLYHDQSLLDDIGRLAAQHFRMVARDLHRGEFEPIYDIDGRNDDILWESWISGFDRAMALRPATFEAIDSADEETLGALGVLMALAMLAVGEFDAAEGVTTGPAASGEANGADADMTLSSEEREALVAEAPDLIPELVTALYDWTRATRSAPDFAVPVRRQQVGRNDPCPCGSGRKYKKCCGASA